jgi:group I intron endonuclease
MNFKSYTAHDLEDLERTGIYVIVNKISSKFYIGSASAVQDKISSCGFYARWHKHVYHLENKIHHCKPLQEAWFEYGPDNFIFQILEFVDADKCIATEQTYLDLFPKGDRDLVYNTCFIAGSSLGYRHTEEAKRKTGEANAREYYLVSPDGVVCEGRNLREFCRINSLTRRALKLVIDGELLHHKGWTKSLETHLIYTNSYETRGICKRGKSWMVSWLGADKPKTKNFKIKEDAIRFRDNMEKEGYNFQTHAPRYWKQQLNATQE